jgi:hypothetical protein
MTRADWELLPDAPAELSSPWATPLSRGEDGLYREAESGRARSLSAWRDRFARHHEAGRPLWRRSPAGVLYIPDGERFTFLREVLGCWSVGVATSAGELAGEWLLHSVPYDVARRAAEEWVIARRSTTVLDVDTRLAGVA